MKTPDLNKRNKALDLYKIKKENIVINDIIVERANEIKKYGIKPIDSLHFASAEYRNVNALLTVDKEFLNNSKQINSSLKVVNPINWFMEEIEND
ncbi:MAG: PIN domain-containing protein [Treponema sp.]|jgi:predicted nucleic acid-binding protein|nr:PIN domain-containing protein [Treponema sp.]